MLWNIINKLFRSKATNSDHIHVKGMWSVLQGNHNGKPILIRLRTIAKELVGDKRYPYRVRIAMPFNHQDKKGMPTSEENQHLDSIEDEIGRLFEDNNEAYICIIITTGGMREFVIYRTKNEGIDPK